MDRESRATASTPGRVAQRRTDTVRRLEVLLPLMVAPNPSLQRLAEPHARVLLDAVIQRPV